MCITALLSPTRYLARDERSDRLEVRVSLGGTHLTLLELDPVGPQQGANRLPAA